MTRFHSKTTTFRHNNYTEVFEAAAKFFLSSSQNLKALLCACSTRQISTFPPKCSKLNLGRNKLQLNSILLNLIFLLMRKSDRKDNHITLTIQCFDIGNHLLIAGFVFGKRDKKKNK